MKTLIAVALVCALVPGCGQKRGAKEPAAKAPEATLPAAGSRRVEIACHDGTNLVGTFTPATSAASAAPGAAAAPSARAPGVLLLHQMGGSRADWNALTPKLTGAGYSVLATDLRGHGESLTVTGTRRTHEKFTAMDYLGMVDDAREALGFLRKQPGVDARRIAIIGASIGANCALLTAAQDPVVKTAVLLSPGSDYHKILTDPVARTCGRPVLLVASEGDAYSVESAKRLSLLMGGDEEALKLYSGSAHGAGIFASHGEELTGAILAWLKEKL